VRRFALKRRGEPAHSCRVWGSRMDRPGTGADASGRMSTPPASPAPPGLASGPGSWLGGVYQPDPGESAAFRRLELLPIHSPRSVRPHLWGAEGERAQTKLTRSMLKNLPLSRSSSASRRPVIAVAAVGGLRQLHRDPTAISQRVRLGHALETRSGSCIFSAATMNDRHSSTGSVTITPELWPACTR